MPEYELIFHPRGSRIYQDGKIKAFDLDEAKAEFAIAIQENYAQGMKLDDIKKCIYKKE